MFGFKKSDKRCEDLNALAASLPKALEAMHPIERATVLVLTNSMLAYAERSYGVLITANPRQVDVNAARTIWDNLAELKSGLDSMAKDMKGTQKRHIACHFHATELVLLTVGLALAQGHSRQLGACWKSVWSARASAQQAVPWLRKYERATGVGTVPKLADGREASDIDLLRFAESLPAFLRRRRA